MHGHKTGEGRRPGILSLNEKIKNEAEISNIIQKACSLLFGQTGEIPAFCHVPFYNSSLDTHFISLFAVTSAFIVKSSVLVSGGCIIK